MGDRRGAMDPALSACAAGAARWGAAPLGMGVACKLLLSRVGLLGGGDEAGEEGPGVAIAVERACMSRKSQS